MMNNHEMTDHPIEQLQTQARINHGKTFAIEFAIHEFADISMHVIVCTLSIFILIVVCIIVRAYMYRGSFNHFVYA